MLCTTSRTVRRALVIGCGDRYAAATRRLLNTVPAIFDGDADAFDRIVGARRSVRLFEPQRLVPNETRDALLRLAQVIEK